MPTGPKRHPLFIVLRALVTLYLAVSLPIQWLVIWLAQCIYRVFAYPFTTFEQRQDMCSLFYRYVSYWVMVKYNPFWRIHTLNKFPEPKKSKRILMLNHLSAADPYVALDSILPRDGCWIAKAVLLKVPIGGWGLANGGDLGVQFRNKRKGFETVKGSVAPMMEEARKKLRRGRMLCVFPEGIRNSNPDGPLNPFRLGFFKLAIEEGAEIIPLAVSGTEKLWPNRAWFMDLADAYFSYAEPVDASNFTSEEELSKHVWNVITEAREKHPDRVALREAQAAQAAAEQKKD